MRAANPGVLNSLVHFHTHGRRLLTLSECGVEGPSSPSGSSRALGDKQRGLWFWDRQTVLEQACGHWVLGKAAWVSGDCDGAKTVPWGAEARMRVSGRGREVGLER